MADKELTSMADVMAKLQAKIANREFQTNSSSNSKEDRNIECEKCQDTELIIEKIPYEINGRQMKNKAGQPITHDVARPCECKPYKQARRLLERSGLTDDFKNYRFDNYETAGKHQLFTAAKKAAEDYADCIIKDFPLWKYQQEQIRKGERIPEGEMVNLQNAAFMGEPGAGKTHLAIAIAGKLLEKRIPVLYFQHREEFDKLKATNFEGSDQMWERVKRFPGLLIWDDLFKTTRTNERGQKMPTPYEIDTTWGVLNYRALKKLPIAFSTEWRPAELANLDRSMAGRVLERAKGHMVTFRLTKEEEAEGLTPIQTFDHRFMV